MLLGELGDPVCLKLSNSGQHGENHTTSTGWWHRHLAARKKNKSTNSVLFSLIGELQGEASITCKLVKLGISNYRLFSRA